MEKLCYSNSNYRMVMCYYCIHSIAGAFTYCGGI